MTLSEADQKKERKTQVLQMKNTYPSTPKGLPQIKLCEKQCRLAKFKKRLALFAETKKVMATTMIIQGRLMLIGYAKHITKPLTKFHYTT